MADPRRFILFELNEVPFRVISHFAASHPRSAFARLIANGCRWETRTPDQGHLSPWITWPTLHRGVSSAEHHVVALGQDVSEVNRRYPPLWTLLTGAGRRVGMFGSLHTYPLPDQLDQYDFYVPDTFAAGPEAKPADLSAFQAFNLGMVDRSGRNVSADLPVGEALRFLLRAMPAGVRPATLGKIARQIAQERVWRDRTSRRRTIQSILAFDLFSAQLNAKRPDAAFFFTNHVASAMHRYWPATFADDYQATQWSAAWIRRFSGELVHTMGEADHMLADLLHFADRNPDYVVLVTGSMGQAAVDSPERQIKTEVLVREMPRFLDRLGVSGPWERRRTMEPTYTLSFADEQGTQRFLDAVATVKIDGVPIDSRRLGACEAEFVLGHPNLADDRLVATIGNQRVSLDELGLANVTIDDEVGAAAYHVPEGTLLLYDPRRDLGGRVVEGTVSTTRIAPTLLALSGVQPPSYMEPPLAVPADAALQAA